MKLSSFFWTYLVLAILYFNGKDKLNNTNYSASEISTDLKKKIVDSVYARLTFSEKIGLLSIYSLKDTILNPLQISTLGYFVGQNDSIILPDKPRGSISGFENMPLRVAFADTNNQFMNNLTIGQTNSANFARYKEAIQAENIRKKGINVILGNYFQVYNPKLKNENISYTQSPLNSEKYWQAMLHGAEENGLKMGVSDPLMMNTSIDSIDNNEFLAIGLSGNRYYSRRGHGIIQLADQKENLKMRFFAKNLKTQQSILREKFRFTGLIVSPDFSPLSIEKQALRALETIQEGTDMVCVSLKLKHNLDSIFARYFEIHKTELETRCLKILNLKYDLYQNNSKSTDYHRYIKQFEYQVKQNSITCIENKLNILPVKDLNVNTYYFTSNNHQDFFNKQLQHYVSPHLFDSNEIEASGICIVDGFNDNLLPAVKWAKKYNGALKLLLVTSQVELSKQRTVSLARFDAIVVAGDTSQLSQALCIQSMFGASTIKGKLPYYLSPHFPMSTGCTIPDISRLGYIDPEYIGISPAKMLEIDEIVKEGISARAFPGCQILVGVEGKIVYEKSFGFQDFSQNSKVDQGTIYDIASITKIAASTTSLMKLQSDCLFSLNKNLSDYIPEIVRNTEFANIQLRDMMAHQAGLPAWIPFYLKTLSGGKPSLSYYSKSKTLEFSVPVAKDLWMKNSYLDTIYARILSSNLKSKSYVYSDLGYYFVKKIVENLSNSKLDEYVQDSIYRKLGLHSMTYNPYLKYDLARIAPTEKDDEFRKQEIRGYVHDPGAAMLGGVGGHAGIFSNANDLAILMQMMLNGGYYGGRQIIRKEVLDEYTAVQFPNSNRRGAGFDKANLNGSEATACALASPMSYGHSGFTGTVTWVDPKNKVNYVFLSNRVSPSASNWKITKMDIRTRIQTKIYQAVDGAEKFNFYP